MPSDSNLILDDRPQHTTMEAPVINIRHSSPEDSMRETFHERGPARVFGSTTTKPEPFSFSLDSRSSSRASTSKFQSRSSHSTSTRVHPIPDYRALHASHNAMLASRRNQIHPTVPLSLELSTESRAKERARFDELLKEKEQEQARMEDEEKRKKAEEELNEVKELRKRAMVKAHEVPEWYKDAPRRKKTKLEDSQ